jgi:hypothetical protein
MDGSATNGEHALDISFVLTIRLRCRRTSGAHPNGPPSKKDGEEERCPEIRQEVQQEIRQENRQEGRQEVGPQILGTEVGQEELTEIRQEE